MALTGFHFITTVCHYFTSFCNPDLQLGGRGVTKGQSGIINNRIYYLNVISRKCFGTILVFDPTLESKVGNFQFLIICNKVNNTQVIRLRTPVSIIV